MSFMVTPIATERNSFPPATFFTSAKTAGTTVGLTDTKITSDFLTTGILSVIASAPKDYKIKMICRYTCTYSLR